ncbi:SubName: Full=Uncharacterized protein {ECO:0000313/EMBL:CCA75764.1} [Serendipita indica DSM 11827]|nr:SubName: Full=Uncharacterized protein {ECO:0000313/EMBL:CCA75764.1} [Serendipita indica DSM 11827]
MRNKRLPCFTHRIPIHKPQRASIDQNSKRKKRSAGGQSAIHSDTRSFESSNTSLGGTLPPPSIDSSTRTASTIHAGELSDIIIGNQTQTQDNPGHPTYEEPKDKKYLTPSLFTQDTLAFYGLWRFRYVVDAQPVEGTERHIYRSKYRYSPREQTIDLDELPELQYESGPVELDYRIIRYLDQEHHRFANQLLVLPKEWEVGPAQPQLRFFEIPDNFAQYMNPKPRKPQEAKPRYSYASDSTSSPPEPMWKSTAGDDSGTSQPSSDERDVLYRELLSKFDLSMAKTEKEKQQMANQFAFEVDTLNRPYSDWVAQNDLFAKLETMELEMRKGKDWIVERLEEIERKDKKIRCGNPAFNLGTQDRSLYPAHVIREFLSFLPPDVSGPDKISEGEIEKTVGGKLRGVFAGKGMMDRHNQPLPFPPLLRAFGTDPSPDIYNRADINTLDWGNEKLMPVFFAGECKPSHKYDEWDVPAQLASAFHGTLVILVLYYLDNRANTRDPLPPWLFLYGIGYTEKNVMVYSHHPAYRPDKDTAIPRWHFVSSELYTFPSAFRDGRRRCRLLSALYRIRSHSLFVLEQLQQWERAKKVLEPIAKSIELDKRQRR